MKTLLSLFLLCSAFFTAQLPKVERSEPHPLLLIDGKIANEVLASKIKPQETKSVSVYKSDKLPAHLLPFSNFALTGIIDIQLKKKNSWPALSLVTLNTKHDLNSLNPVYIDGVPVPDPQIEVLEEAVMKMEVLVLDGRSFLSLETATSQSSESAENAKP